MVKLYLHPPYIFMAWDLINYSDTFAVPYLFRYVERRLGPVKWSLARRTIELDNFISSLKLKCIESTDTLVIFFFINVCVALIGRLKRM
jgi:hypothetical protein